MSPTETNLSCLKGASIGSNVNYTINKYAKKIYDGSLQSVHTK